MDIDDQFSLEHLLFSERKCCKCGEIKNLLENFYLSRKNRSSCPSAYSYECKLCTIERIVKKRKEKKNRPDISYDPVHRIKDIYPDW
tara:strand:- start:364 stop:624 length:261 start_codon:yes stop_codon:yes gene_type:complete